MTTADADVVVVGYGPVGALAALLLGRAGVRTVAVDRRREVYPLPRAVAADDDVLRLLRSAGLSEAVSGMLPARGARFVGASGARLLDVDVPGTGGGPGLALYRQPDLERALRAAAARLPAVGTRLGTAACAVEQDDDVARVRLDDGTTLTARYVVACDGAGSRVRRSLGIPTLGPATGQSWLVVDGTGPPPPWIHPERVTYVCDPARPAVAMPTPGGWRLEALQPAGHRTGPVDLPTAAGLADGRLDGLLDAVERACVYRFATARAATWRAGRVLLAGDAAHTMGPFAGQGLAAGLRDVDDLAAKLALVVDGRADGSLLDTYERDRLPHLRRMTTLTRLVGALVTAPRGVAPLRDAALRSVAAVPAVAGRLHPIGVAPRPAGAGPRRAGVVGASGG